MVGEIHHPKCPFFDPNGLERFTIHTALFSIQMIWENTKSQKRSAKGWKGEYPAFSFPQMQRTSVTRKNSSQMALEITKIGKRQGKTFFLWKMLLLELLQTTQTPCTYYNTKFWNKTILLVAFSVTIARSQIEWFIVTRNEFVSWEKFTIEFRNDWINPLLLL